METEQFLKESLAAKKVTVEARVVIRRFASAAGEIRDAVGSGTIDVRSAPICELVAGDAVLGRGEIRMEDGVPQFVMTEAAK